MNLSAFRYFLVLICCTLIVPLWCRAEEPALSTGMANQMRYVAVGVVSGRVTASSEYSGRSISSSANAADKQERLTINLSSTQLDLHYELTTPQLQVSVDVTDGDELTILRQPRSGSDVVPLKFHQPRDGQLVLQLGEDGEHRELWKFDSLWHLLLAEPELCGQELMPLMRLLKPGWQLLPQAEAVQEAMFTTAQASRSWNRDTWGQMVSDLGSDRFAVRRQAEQQLRELGQVVLPFLRRLDRQRLDAEQSFRVRMLIRELSGATSEDTPQRVASWLVADPAMWYTLLERTDGDQQKIALAQLGQLLGEPVEYDFDADPATRRAQRLAIEQQIQRASKQ